MTKAFEKYIDHTLLKADARDPEFDILTNEAIKYNFGATCVAPYIAGGVSKALLGYPGIKVATVCAFPQGNLPLQLKLNEAQYLIEQGVDEIDFVLHYGEVLSGNWDRVEAELYQMGEICSQGNVISKCIVETPALRHPALLRCIFTTLRDHSCIDYIKSSTGMSWRSTLVEEIAFWNEIRDGGDRPLIKAAGGIKTYEDAIAMIKAGADRLGMSASVKIMEEHLANPSAFFEGGTSATEVYVECKEDVGAGTLV